MDFSLIERAGLTQREFGSLCGVSRVTVNLWVTNKMGPHRYIRDRVSSILEAIGVALDGDQLPLARSIPRERRGEALENIVRPALVGQSI